MRQSCISVVARMKRSALFLFAALLGMGAFPFGDSSASADADDAAAGVADEAGAVPASSERVTESGGEVVVHQDQGDKISKEKYSIPKFTLRQMLVGFDKPTPLSAWR